MLLFADKSEVAVAALLWSLRLGDCSIWCMHKGRLLSIAACSSAGLLAVLLGAFLLISREQENGPVGWRLWGDIRIASIHENFALHNCEYAYTGSVVKVMSGLGPKIVEPEWPHISEWDYLGLHYTRFDLESGQVWWTFYIDIAWLIVVTSILPLIWFFRLFLRVCRNNGTPQ